jgi:hypothetical protein
MRVRLTENEVGGWAPDDAETEEVCLLSAWRHEGNDQKRNLGEQKTYKID